MKHLVNFLSKLGVDTVSRLLSLVTLPVITRAVGPEGYGEFVYLFVLYGYYGFFIDFGYLSYGTNELVKNNTDVVNRIISTQLLTALLSTVVLLSLGRWLVSAELYPLLLIFSLQFFLLPFSIKYYHLARHRLYYISLSELTGQLLFLVLILTVFRNRPSVRLLVIITVLRTTVTATMQILPFLRSGSLHLRFNLRQSLEVLRGAYKLGISAKLESLTTSSVPLFLGMFVGKEAVGYYGAASRVFTILLTVAQSLNQAVLPTVLQAVKRLNPLDITKAGMVLYLNLALGLALGAGTWLGAPLITALLFGEEFTATTGILRIFALTIAVWPLMMYLGTLMIARDHYEDFLKMTIISLVTAVTADLTLIPRLQLTGAALVLPVAALATIITGLSIIGKAARRGEFPGKAVFAPASVAQGFRRWREEKRRGK